MDSNALDAGFIVVLIALLGHAVETDDLFSVDYEIIKTIWDSMIVNGQQPELTFDNVDGRVVFSVRLINQEEENE